jgi:DNA ligase (NAD+)
MKVLVDLLNQANDAYYNKQNPIMSDATYDEYYDELLQLEKITGIIFSNSPTQKVGYEVKSKLEKVSHPIPLLSLDKTKDIEKLKKWMGNHECIISLKLDGLTTKLNYKNQTLKLGATRGNGEIGEDVTHNAKVINGVPLKIPTYESLSLVGESIITFKDFNTINEKLLEEERYASPRHLASGSLRQLDSKICAERNVKYFAFALLESEHKFQTKSEQLNYLKSQGFNVVPFVVTNKDNVEDHIEALIVQAHEADLPIDGLVISYNDVAYAESLGRTSKFPRHSLAFKLTDEILDTTYLGTEYNTTRTGMISITALFEPVEVDGVTLERASLHNVDIFESLQLGRGDTIQVYKANQVIPQVYDNLTRSNTEKLISNCPTCNHPVEIRKPKEARFLYCTNPNCPAKLLQRLVHFVSRNAMNIEGLSEATLEKFIEQGFINEFADIYRLEQYKKEIIQMDGFGLKSYNNLIKAIEKSKEVELHNFIFALGIPKVGLSNAKLLSKELNYDFDKLWGINFNQLIKIEGFGEEISKSIISFFNNQNNIKELENLREYIVFKKPQPAQQNSSISGKTFVVTGDVHVFANRKELQAKIESLGAKCASSVSTKTDYLINNDINSSSSKNKKAKELGIPIITEEEFIKMIKN